MKFFSKVFSMLLIFITLFPMLASAAQVQEPFNLPASIPDITIIKTVSPYSTTYSSYPKREAVVRHTAQQYLMEGEWQNLFNVTYKTLWFSNGVRNLGYREIARKNGWNYVLYTFQWDYQTY